MLFSRDQGRTWTQPRPLATMRSAAPLALGGGRLLVRVDTHSLLFSDDAGTSWSQPEPIPLLTGGRASNSDVALSCLVEGNAVTCIFYANKLPPEKGLETFLRRYDTASHTWSDPVVLPANWTTSEGALARAATGELVAVFRSDRPQIPPPDKGPSSDHWSGLISTRSADNGLTWSEPTVETLYGHVHQSLLRLADGRLLMTYGARIGELDGRDYQGIEAVISHDHGRTWDWERRYILFRGTSSHMQSPQSVVLSDGRILTCFMHHADFPWATDGDRRGKTPVCLAGRRGDLVAAAVVGTGPSHYAVVSAWRSRCASRATLSRNGLSPYRKAIAATTWLMLPISSSEAHSFDSSWKM